MAVFDWVASIAAATVIGLVLRLRSPLAWVSWGVFWVGFGLAIHKVVGVNTMLGYYMGINVMPKRDSA
jgi:hypothetical protein